MSQFWMSHGEDKPGQHRGHAYDLIADREIVHDKSSRWIQRDADGFRPVHFGETFALDGSPVPFRAPATKGPSFKATTVGLAVRQLQACYSTGCKPASEWAEHNARVGLPHAGFLVLPARAGGAPGFRILVREPEACLDIARRASLMMVPGFRAADAEALRAPDLTPLPDEGLEALAARMTVRAAAMFPDDPTAGAAARAARETAETAGQ